MTDCIEHVNICMIKHENKGQYEGAISCVAVEEKDRKHLEKAPKRE